MSDLFQGFGHALQSTNHALGGALDQTAHEVGHGLDAVGLHGVAHAVDSAGDKAADMLGGDSHESQLGETDDPKELLHGDVDGINQSVDHLSKFAKAFGETASGFARMDSSHWQGQAADAFRAKFDPHTKMWADAATASAGAAKALAGFSEAVHSAQALAESAIELYKRAQQETDQAESAYKQQVSDYNAKAQVYNQSASSGGNQDKPQQPGQFTDPGAADRARAQEMLNEARKQRDSAAAEASGAIKRLIDLAPAEPSFTDKLGAEAHDALKSAPAMVEHYYGGLIKSVGGVVKLARSLNPADPYNVTHPAEYLSGLSNTAAGLATTAINPAGAVTSMLGSGWGSDPLDASGALVGNIGVGLVTGGMGGAAESAGGAALREATATQATVEREVAEVAGREVKPIDTSPAGAAPTPPAPPAEPLPRNFGPGWQEREYGQGDFGPTGELPPEPKPAAQPGEPEPGDHPGSDQPRPEPGNLDAKIDDALAHNDEYLRTKAALDSVRDGLRTVQQGSVQESDLIGQRNALEQRLEDVRQKVGKQVRDGLY